MAKGDGKQRKGKGLQHRHAEQTLKMEHAETLRELWGVAEKLPSKGPNAKLKRLLLEKIEHGEENVGEEDRKLFRRADATWKHFDEEKARRDAATPVARRLVGSLGY